MSERRYAIRVRQMSKGLGFNKGGVEMSTEEVEKQE